MPTTLESLLVILVAVIPGLSFERGIEHRLSFWRTDLASRVPRFVGWSTIFHILFAPLTIATVRNSRSLSNLVASKSRLSFDALNGAFPIVNWILLLAYVAVPFAAGSVLGKWGRNRVKSKRFAIARLFTGKNPQPLSWDDLFAPQAPGYLRVRLKNGTFHLGSLRYASSYPEEQDLLIDAIASDVEGNFLLGPSGNVVVTDWTLHIKRQDCDEIQFQPFQRNSND
jgi:hypothetical protein